MIVGWPADPLTHNIYSPYQLIQTATQHDGLMKILAGGSYYQKIHNLRDMSSDENLAPPMRRILGYYDLPFKAANSLKDVAIIGAGSGNDVAAALRNGAESVDAVEIDPVIHALGRANHPENPYGDSKVNSVINDARNFFRSEKKQYDAIVYGVLDSHVVLSYGANMRTDSFVYTLEGLKSAYDHLKPGGLMSVSFALPNDYLGYKIFRILDSFPGKGSLYSVLTGYDAKKTTTFLISKKAEIKLPQDFMARHDLTDRTGPYRESLSQPLDLPTDDWPFFYMKARMYPSTYVLALVLVLGLTVFLVRRLLPRQKWDPSLLPFFFLGAGFMLVETKAITELGLLFGNTWQIVGIAIMSVLVMAFLANMMAARSGKRIKSLAYMGLFGVIGLGYFIAVQGGRHVDTLLLQAFFIVLLVSPLFFSGLIFSSLLSGTKNVSGAMAYNLIGAMLGGVLEYNAMQFGFASLYLIAIVLYALSWIALRWGRIAT